MTKIPQHLLERAKAAREQVMETKRLEVGDETHVLLKVKVVDVSDAHGLCYKVEALDNPGYGQARTIWVEPNETRDL